MNNIKRRYSKLLNMIREADHNYYTLDKPTITDERYDELFDELVSIEINFPQIKVDDSPTSNVGGQVLDGFERKEHAVPMLSLDKAQDKGRIAKFFSDTKAKEYVLEWKYDGLAFVARYENGKFTEARTRGNGFEGEVITEQVKTIKSIPKRIDFDGILEVSGEIYMPFDSFERFNNRQLELAKKYDDDNKETRFPLLQNPRNGAAGAIRQLDPMVTRSRNLEAAVFNILVLESNEEEIPQTMVETKTFLGNLGFKTTSMLETFAFDELERLIDKIDDCEKIRDDLPFEVDGLVIKVNDKVRQEQIGYTNSFPKWAIAYKFEAVEKQSKLLDVIWDVGRTGRVTPIAILEPIDFDGVTVTRATLNNPEYIRALDLKLGSEVAVRRSNDVIPQIMHSLGSVDGKDIVMPTKCPVCGEELIYNKPLLFCANDTNCNAQVKSKIIHFASRNAFDIRGLSERTVEQLLDAGYIKDPSDIFTLNKDVLLKLERFGSKKADNLLGAIEGSKNIRWSEFIYSLGIPSIGNRASRLLADHYDSYEDLLNATLEDLITIDSFGEKTAIGILNYLSDGKNKEMINKLFELGVNIVYPEEKEKKDEKLKDKVFVITGRLSKPRSYFKELIEELGGAVRGSVSGNTDYLLAGEAAGSKLKQAQDLSVVVLSEEQFNELLI